MFDNSNLLITVLHVSIRYSSNDIFQFFKYTQHIVN